MKDDLVIPNQLWSGLVREKKSLGGGGSNTPSQKLEDLTLSVPATHLLQKCNISNNEDKLLLLKNFFGKSVQ